MRFITRGLFNLLTKPISTPSSNWILANGTWADSGVWDDSAVWKDS